DGEVSLPIPRVSHFAGTIEGEPDSSVYLGVTRDALVAYVHSSRGHAYVGPDESNASFVVRTADSPLNAAASGTAWHCGSEELPAPLTAMAEPSFAAPQSPDVAGFKQASIRIETDFQLYQHFGSDPNAVATYVLTLFGAVNVIYERDVQMHLTV